MNRQAAGGNIVLPAMLNMVVGDTHTVRALGPTGQPAKGLTWTSSDPTVVSLSSSGDDPPAITALTAGHVTITAGAASADVTVYADALPMGTVVWSNPGNGSGVTKIVPAVPSASGVADVFAFQGDGTVRAITSDGLTAWTSSVDLSMAWKVVPDLQGGLVVAAWDTSQGSIVKLDGITGQTYPAYRPDGESELDNAGLGVHTDGTIFAIQRERANGPASVIGIDPTTGTRKFSVSLNMPSDSDGPYPYGVMIAGDGYAYVPYAYREMGIPDSFNHLRLLRIDTAGVSDLIQIADFTTAYSEIWGVPTYMITNGDTGARLSWSAWNGDTPVVGMAVTKGTSVSVVSTPQVPGQIGAVVPVLQAQDGSFVGTAWTGEDGDVPYMVAFDATGSVRYSVPGYGPRIATADGGVIAQAWDPDTSDFTGPAVTFDQNGNATGQMGSLPVQSWTGNLYRYGSTEQYRGSATLLGASFWAQAGGMYSPGVAFVPLDSVSTNTVNDKVNGLLNADLWQKFKSSVPPPKGTTCAAVFAQGIPSIWAGGVDAPFNVYDKNLKAVQVRQSTLNFYDTGNPRVAKYRLSEVTVPQDKRTVTLVDYLSNVEAVAATPLFGRPGPVILAPKFLDPTVVTHPEVVLLHEVLLHAYAGVTDDQVLGRTGYTFFLGKGLHDDGVGSSTISSWISTDCNCTPKFPDSCQPYTAPWLKK